VKRASRRRRAALLTWLVLAAASWPNGAVLAEPVKIAVLDLELIDTSGEGETREQFDRLRLVSAEMRTLLEESDMFRVVDLAPAAGQVEAAGYIHGCNGCEIDIARGLGARLVLVGTVHKVSSLVLSVSVVITDTRTEKVVRVRTVAFRGNTDESWLRGVRYLVRNYLVAE